MQPRKTQFDLSMTRP
nr:unnamed protein product [Callosobruchus chinensis]